MASTEQELESFTSYAKERIEEGTANISIDELFDLWRAENPSDITHAEDVSAVAGAIEDFKNGDRGRPAGQLSQELRQQFGLSSE